VQTDDMLRTLGSAERSARARDALIGLIDDRIAVALERIADALEQRNRIDEAMANFAQVLQRGAAPAEDTDVAPDGMPRKQR
jgi:hypothetical protein